MREAAWDHRLALAGLRSGKLNAANLMPLRYSGEKFNEELKVCAIQARMTAQWSDAVASWAESRVWWAARPSDLVATWAAEFQTVVLEALREQPVPSMALGIEELTREVGEAKLHETEFMLANDIKPPVGVEHVTCKVNKEKKASHVVKPIPVETTGWICSARKGSAVHRNCGGMPACQKKQSLARAHFKGGTQLVHTIEEAEALAAMNMGRVCRICAAMEERTRPLLSFSFVKREGRGCGYTNFFIPPRC